MTENHKLQMTKLKSMLHMAKILRRLNAEMTAQQTEVLFRIAIEEGIGVRQMTKRTGQTQSSASRNMRMLMNRYTPTQEGLGLVEWREHPNDFRARCAYLTPSGKQFINTLCSVYKTTDLPEANPPSNFIKIQRMLALVESLRKLNGEMTIQQLEVLLSASIEQGIGVREMTAKTGQTQSSASRNMRMLMKQYTPTKEGLDFFEWRACAHDFRAKGAHLTPKGKQVLANLCSNY